MHALIIATAALTVAGCSTSGDYRDYLTAQYEASKLAAQQPPLFRLVAQEGQAISGLKSIEVFTPAAPAQIQQARPSEWAGVLGQGLSVVGALGGVYLGGEAAQGLAHVVGQSAGQGYQYINPTPVIAPKTTVVRPEVVQPPPAQVIQVPTQVIEQPTVVTVPGGT